MYTYKCIYTYKCVYTCMYMYILLGMKSWPFAAEKKLDNGANFKENL